MPVRVKQTIYYATLEQALDAGELVTSYMLSNEGYTYYTSNGQSFMSKDASDIFPSLIKELKKDLLRYPKPVSVKELAEKSGKSEDYVKKLVELNEYPSKVLTDIADKLQANWSVANLHEQPDGRYSVVMDKAGVVDYVGIVPAEYVKEGILECDRILAMIPPKREVGYHTTKIEKGVYGEFSKVEEEFKEAKDALEQGNTPMLFLELSDVIGAIDGFLKKNHPSVTLDSLVKMAQATRRAFATGARIEH